MFDISSIGLADILPFIAVGFVAQLVDGALGMAFGVLTQTMLVAVLGVPPATASASVHLVEVFTTGASGTSHIIHRNVDWKLFWRLVPAGIIGGVSGAYLLSSIDASAAKPFVMAYLTVIGFYLLYKAVRHDPDPHFKDPKATAPLALTGGFLDAAGGGGWGPVVTSNLLVQGSDPRKTVGTVNSAEFLITLTISITFLGTLGLAAFTHAVIGLIIGGVAAAPFGAIFAKRLNPRFLLAAVSLVLIATSLFSIIKAWPIF
ncbi:sulfite exporter TauE/SafE family protein [Altererythrobacter sp. CC-YST694]|uniref:sulfite exporter TauE/SafE family protein n=1 Tax=Altererythrobacter sp. CC-YST694 TaxID=2755038 RepID=UPI001D0190B5|nr:sulfite exporter TauE/SafE family protein [Altererythrobacter sp. CC-YST694]MCB5423923.1 sulfite exporter TauE/SafE family protein [Altererythrobacter sp. CC-YST694]